MPQVLIVSISLSKDTPAAERERLLTALRSVSDIREPTERAFGPEWITFVAVLHDIGTAAKDVAAIGGAATAIVAFARELKAWRDAARKGGREPKARLQRPDREPLDINTASDRDIDKWLS